MTSGLTMRLCAITPLDHLVIHDDPQIYSFIEPISHVSNGSSNLRTLGQCQKLTEDIEVRLVSDSDPQDTTNP